jgi:transcriptional regulator with XRE-family HTH domain
MARREEIEDRFSKRLKAERERREWSQIELAKRLSDKGIHMSGATIAKIEADKPSLRRSVRVEEASVFADVLGVSVDSLLGRRSGRVSDLANSIRGMQQAAGRASLDVEAIYDLMMGWFIEIWGDEGVEFDGREDFEIEGRMALEALAEAKTALHRISTMKKPKRISVGGQKEEQ